MIDIAHQNPHALRLSVAALLDHPADLVTVRCGDIGGSFGQKAYTSREEIAVCVAARQLARPVKWIEDRVENLLAAGHARDDVIAVDLAVAEDATILGARVRMSVNQGAYPITVFPPTIILNLVRVLFPNAYRIANYSFEGTVVASNTGTYIAFRGPWESETWARERIIDLAAHALGMEPADVRSHNLIGTDEQPTTMVTGPTIDHMTAHDTHERARELADITAFRARATRRARGRPLPRDRVRDVCRSRTRARPTTAPRSARDPRPGRRSRRGHGSSATAPSACSRASSRTARATRPRWRSSRPTGSVSRSSRCASCTATPASRRSTRWAPGGSRSATLASGAVVGAAAMLRDRIAELFAERHELDPSDVEVAGGSGQRARRARVGVGPGPRSPSSPTATSRCWPTSRSPTAAGPRPRTAAGSRST